MSAQLSIPSINSDNITEHTTGGGVFIETVNIKAGVITNAVVTANALATTSADVNVDAAAPPNINQVLTATSATTAVWADTQFPANYYQYAVSDSTSTNTTTTPSTKVTFTTSTLPTGEYFISWYAEYYINLTTTAGIVETLLDASVIGTSRTRVFTASTDRLIAAGIYPVNFGSATTHTVLIQFSLENTLLSPTMTIQNARISIEKKT